MAIAYGTAGFRDKASVLPEVCNRVGMLAALRSRFLGGKYVGVMITASHNPPEDNGAKIVEPLGEMLPQSWESYATDIANATDPQAKLQELYAHFDVDTNTPARVVVGRDTRPSGVELISRLKDGLGLIEVADVGVVTTPQLHYIVRAKNDSQFGLPTLDGYYQKHARALESIVKPQNAITVDCANGVGALSLEKLAPLLPFKLTIANNSHDPMLLNVDCGADYVKTGQKLPAGITPHANELYASFDGDADRVVCYYVDASNKFHLLDGDKIATLAADFLKELVPKGTNLGVVQTAYANGASTLYLEAKDIPVVCVPTGVKHLHHAAIEFDVGIYFEANGHGTVVFKPEFIAKLDPTDRKHAMLLALNQLINQAVGDAVSDLLMVIVILALRQWTPNQWDECYTDLPNKLLKAQVHDRTIFKTTDAERKLSSPEGLQAKLDALMKQFSKGRTFVRASGTENVVRVYAEAETAADTAQLAEQVLDLLKPYSV